MGGRRRARPILVVVACIVAAAAGCTGGGSAGGDGTVPASADADARKAPVATGPPVAASVRTLDLPSVVPPYGTEVGVDVANDDGDLVALVGVSNGVVTVRRSHDHGRSWTEVKIPHGHYVSPASTWVRSIGTTFVVVGATDTRASYEQEGPEGGSAKAVAARSTDGGRTWTVAELPMPSGALRGPDVFAAGDGRTAVIVGRFFPTTEGVLAGGWRSTDDGASWRFLPPSALGTEPVIVDHVSTDGGAARIWTTTISPEGHRLLRSEDGGATWGAEADPPSVWPARGDSFIGRRWWRVDDGYGAVGTVDPGGSDRESEPRLLHSDDDGRTWKAVGIGPVRCAAGVGDDPLRRMSSPVQAGSILVVMTSCDDDSDGDPDPRAGLWGSTDGGAHWGEIAMAKRARTVQASFEFEGTPMNGSAWFLLEGVPVRAGVDPDPDVEPTRAQALVVSEPR